MKIHQLIDVLVIIAAFVIFILTLNSGEGTADCPFLCRHIWLPLVIAYYTGRIVSGIPGRKK